MQHPVSIKNALISVFYKDGLEPILEELHRLGVTIYSTGGTASFIQDQGIPVEQVEQLTSYPSILGGRVKTLHPRVFGGILARRSVAADLEQMDVYGLPSFDLVIVDLYPFSETIRQTSDEQAIIEKIDIGGVSLIRAAAKNFEDVMIIASKDQYGPLLDLLVNQQGQTNLEQRKAMAAAAFELIRNYDTAIASWMSGDDVAMLEQFGPKQALRYGENPHQQAAFYGDLESVFTKLQGKDLSYNNLVDVESAVQLMDDLNKIAAGKPAFAILKHTNACGVAIADTLDVAWDKALAADPVSAFGGVLIANSIVDAITAEKINALFFEVIIAPDYAPAALSILQGKKNRIILIQRSFDIPAIQFRTLLNGVLAMDRNSHLSKAEDLKVVTSRKPSQAEIDDLLFAELVVKHLKSNGIALVKNRQLIAMGTGQTSRVDALNQAIHKAAAFGFDTAGAVMASEAFFPFPDCVEIADLAGIQAVIQPGGSIKDQDSINYCDVHGMTMALTGIRHFKH
jgi:phosphoribosylaminoimidazolecarboxamide formyltransferase / IMP cyclohydrolase